MVAQELVPTVEELAASIARLEARVALLEQMRPDAPPQPEPEPRAATPARTGDPLQYATLAGRSLIFLGGAYLLRATADSHLLGVAVAAGIGLVYAAMLLGLADRAASRGAVASSLFHYTTGLLIVVPLIDEMVARFGLLHPAAGATLIIALIAAFSLMAHRRRLAAMVGLGNAFVLAIAIALIVQTHTVLPSLWVVVALYVASLALARDLDRPALVWPAAVGANLAVCGLAQLVRDGVTVDGPFRVLATTLALFAVATAGPLLRSLRDRNGVTRSEKLQVALVLLTCALQGSWMARGIGDGPVFSSVILVFAAGGLALAWRHASAPFWSTFWIITILAELAFLATGPTLTLIDLGIAGAGVLVARRGKQSLGELHALLALAAAALASGLVRMTAQALLLPPDALSPPTPWVGVTLVALALLALVARTAGVKIAAMALAGVALAGLIAFVVITRSHASPAVAATLRTGILAVLAIVMAAVSRHPRERAASALVYPVLLVIAVKFAIEDLRVGVAATLFVGLLLYGAALIVAPRLRRHHN